MCLLQICRASLVRQVETIIGIITAAVVLWLVAIVTVLGLGHLSNPYLNGLQDSLHARMLFGIITWGAFVLSIYVVVILGDAVGINVLQKRHVNAIAALKVSACELAFATRPTRHCCCVTCSHTTANH
jgi:hypothetical protein